VTLVILRSDLLERVPKTLPTMLDYRVQAENKSLYNTPPVFGVYIMGLVMKWLVSQGGLPAIQKKNEEKARVLPLDAPCTHARRQPCPNMNVTFRLLRGPESTVPRCEKAGLDSRAARRRHPALLLQRLPRPSPPRSLPLKKFARKA
jgi:phosphoserine aminotransferase